MAGDSSATDRSGAVAVDVGPGFGDVLRHPPFAWLSAAQLQSLVGDQVARVALSVLVFDRSGSALLTAATYALTFAPALVGGLLLSGFADRFGRRSAMVWADLLRLVMFAVMSIKAVPLGVVVVLVAIAVAVGAMFQAAAPAMVADLFKGESQPAAFGVRSMVSQLGALAGFAGAGFLVAGLGARQALLVDAVSFGVSAVMLRYGLRAVPGGGAGSAAPSRERPSLRARLHGAIDTPERRQVVWLTLLVGFWIVPEAVAAPYAADLGGSALAVGLLLAAVPVGAVAGAAILMRAIGTARRGYAARVMAVGAGVPLVLTGFTPSLLITGVLWLVTGVATAYLAQMNFEYVQLIPNSVRSQYLGVVGSGLIVTQGLGALAAGAVAQIASPAIAVAAAGALGTVLALVVAVRQPRRIKAEVA